MFQFGISGVETYWWLPPLTAFAISCFTSMGGISGAVLILPFQVSVLGFVGPAVSPTNLLYNIIAIPSGVLRYVREKRMIWPLAWTIVAATAPGLFIGALVRIRFLSGERPFKLFAGLVLIYIGYRILETILKGGVEKRNIDARFEVSDVRFSVQALRYQFNGVEYTIVSWRLFLLAFIVGMVGGIYGIGGGAIIAPFLVGIFNLPVHSIAGVTLFGTWLTSLVGVLFYTGLSSVAGGTGQSVAPDWALGLAFGVGGALGMFVGARIQRFVPAKAIKVLLVVLVGGTGIKYIVEFFAR
ncbi:MAG: sulfite exporter TauE/SafE family protein [Calditrichaeota bacterium]|nr:sulfite exporter TauE/SafE family protein [Calditrichota bacterium]